MKLPFKTELHAAAPATLLRFGPGQVMNLHAGGPASVIVLN
jgi:hypothetical protein